MLIQQFSSFHLSHLYSQQNSLNEAAEWKRDHIFLLSEASRGFPFHLALEYVRCLLAENWSLFSPWEALALDIFKVFSHLLQRLSQMLLAYSDILPKISRGLIFLSSCIATTIPLTCFDSFLSTHLTHTHNLLVFKGY